MRFDIIGDVHGLYYKRVGLLQHMGYLRPDQVQIVELVPLMEASDAACYILGYHELNAIAAATPDSQSRKLRWDGHRE